ncbi:MAG: hypothetical protein ACYC35_00455 [Pirellulales bacterium]
MNWFNVDKAGLAKLMAGRSKAFVLYELLQNAWDQPLALNVSVTITPVNGRPMSKIVVEDDDAEGFADLAHAYTLFAESTKKDDAEKRGRFNLGEKLVLALSHWATIETTKGTVRFDNTGRHETRSRRKTGSCVTVSLPLTRAEHAEVTTAAFLVIPPKGVKTTINGKCLPYREAIAEFTVTLPTVIADAEGVMKPTNRQTIVRIHEPAICEVATLYEMGIPVVETGDRYHVDVQQKVPLNMDRDNVTPSYLRAIRVAVLNATHDRLNEVEATKTWVKEAMSDDRVDNAAVRRTLGLRFGKNAVAYDPSDPEANKRSVAEGRQVVHGGNLSGPEWDMARRAGVLPAAGTVTPSPKPYSDGGKPLNCIPLSDWTEGMQRFAAFAKMIGYELLGANVSVQIAREFGWNYDATYGPNTGLVVNLMRVGHKFFETIGEDQLDLLIHEYGHHYCGDHLAADFHRALTRLGAKMTMLAVKKPGAFQ